MANTFSYSLLIPATLVLLHLSKPSQAQPSFISASPSILPTDPFSSIPPALSPDLMPVFPTPKHGAQAASPPESEGFPTIPSSPSPPNPDNIGNDSTPDVDEPHSAIAPTGSKAMSSSTVTVRLGSLVNFWGGLFSGVLMLAVLM